MYRSFCDLNLQYTSGVVFEHGMSYFWNVRIVEGVGGLEYRQEMLIAGHLDEKYVVVMLLVVNILKEI